MEFKPHCFTRRAEGLPHVEHDKGDAVRTAFFALAKALSKPDPDPNRVKTWFRDKVPEVMRYARRNYFRKWKCTVLFVPKHAELLGKLYAEVQDGMERAYLSGKHDGSHLLTRLANGEITPGQFEEERTEA